MKYLIVIFCLFLTACKDDCVDNGGKWILNGYVPTWQNINNISMMVMNPIYICEKK